jgi:hypothetical protein
VIFSIASGGAIEIFYLFMTEVGNKILVANRVTNETFFSYHCGWKIYFFSCK